MTTATDDQIIADVDAIMGDYLRLLSRDLPTTANITRQHCMGLIAELKVRLLAKAKP